MTNTFPGPLQRSGKETFGSESSKVYALLAPLSQGTWGTLPFFVEWKHVLTEEESFSKLGRGILLKGLFLLRALKSDPSATDFFTSLLVQVGGTLSHCVPSVCPGASRVSVPHLGLVISIKQRDTRC